VGCAAGTDDVSGVTAHSSALTGKAELQLMCQVPSGNPTKAREIEVPSHAVAAHLAQGDQLGPCVAPGPCAGQADGTPCNDSDLCTINDVCLGGVCTPGTPVTCSDRGACESVGTCDPFSGTCVYTPLPDGTPCTDQNSCTIGTCEAGVCPADGMTDGFIDLMAGETKTFTCPSDAQAADGIVQPSSCLFPHSLAFNLDFTGPVSLISHLSRDYAGFDIFTLESGDLQLFCMYEDSAGDQVGGTYGITNAASCTATDTSFICTK
jgi:hypothetical protein